MNGPAEVLKLNMSISSDLRKIQMMCNELPSGTAINQLLLTASCTLGVPGCGKSTSISKKIKRGDVAIA